MTALKRFAAPACLAALCVTATPIAAAPVVPTAPADAVWGESGETAQNHRRYGWGRHRDRVDAGDVITGVVILGGIAAVLDAVRDNRERREVRERDWRDEDWRDREWRDAEWPPRERDQRVYRPSHDRAEDRPRSAIETAAATCTAEVEREARVNSIDGVERTSAGWEVRGTLSDGAGFTCQVGGDGRVIDIDYSLRRDRPVRD